jgi:hypothetical protein
VAPGRGRCRAGCRRRGRRASFAEGHAVHRGGDVGREGPRVRRALPVVVDASQELGGEGDAEEVVRVGEEAHTGDHDGGEVVPLRLGSVQSAQHLKVLSATATASHLFCAVVVGSYHTIPNKSWRRTTE